MKKSYLQCGADIARKKKESTFDNAGDNNQKGQKKKVSDKQQACPSLSAVHVGLLASSSPASLM